MFDPTYRFSVISAPQMTYHHLFRLERPYHVEKPSKYLKASRQGSGKLSGG